jgi:hypothetical protein
LLLQIGIAVTNTIFTSKLAGKLPNYIAAATLPLGLNPAQLGPVIGAATGDEALIATILAGRIPGITPQMCVHLCYFLLLLVFR